MPPALQSHRSWGTRYDSLVDAAPAPSSSPPNANNNHSFRPPNYDNSVINTSNIPIIPSATTPPPFPLHNDAVKERPHMQPQHQDEKYSERFQNTDSNTERYSSHNPNQHSPTGVHARMPHDASVFVASLPSHLADPELQALLTEHLNHYATIKHVKLIRDNRNAVCAFVQAQSATEATELIDKCNLSLFMDRQIRCERARAFRTLLVSWVKQEELNHTGSAAGHVSSPQSLRLRRCRGSRFVQITSGTDAFCADPQQLANCSLPRADDPLSGAGVFFESGIVEGDLKSLKRLMEAFGPLEFIMPFDPKIHQTTGDNELESSSVDRPADGTLKDSVEIERENIDGMWAVKWEHRNDAVSAVTALQAIGNLCVRWCHTYGQTGLSAGENEMLPDTGHSSNPTTPYRSVHHSNPTTPHRPRVFGNGNQWYHGNNGYQHKQDQCHINHDHPLNYDQNSTRGRFNYGNNSGVIGPTVHRSAKHPLSFSESDFPPLNGNSNSLGNSTQDNVNDNSSEPNAGTRIGYSSDEMPRRDIEKPTVWNGNNSTFSRSNAPSPSPPHESQPILPSLWLPLETSPNTSAVAENNNNMSDRTDSSEGEVIPCTPETPDLEPEAEDGSASGVETPLTPGFSEAPHTPRSAYISSLSFCNVKSGGQSGIEHGKVNGHGSKINLQDNMARSSDDNFLINHTSSHIRTNSTSKSVNVPLITTQSHRHHASQSQLDHEQERDGDEFVMVSPTTSPTISAPASDRELFVGGLSVDGWGEERLRHVFSQYGPIEELRFIKPYHAPVHRRGFAFVRYVNCEDAQKAIHGQHMRLYGDHKIKVQLRDTQPNSRRPQWSPRGRTRYNQGQGHSHHDQNREDDTKQNSPSPGRDSPDQSPDKERLLSIDEVTPKYPCITDPLSEEEEAALRRDFIHDKDSSVIHQSPSNIRSPDERLSSTSPFTSPPRADSVRRATQSESGLRSPPPTSNADALSTYAPSSTESAPPSSSYYAYPGVTNAWAPPYTLYAHDYSHPGNNTTIPPAQSVPSDPWMGVYRNMLPAVPWFNPPPGVELTTAPLHPTGYIQRDGIFIPVYPPERLGQYMCNTSNGTDNGSGDGQQARTTSPSTTVGPKSTTPPATSTPSWTMTSTHPPQPYPYPMPYAIPPHAVMLPPHMTHPSYQAQWMSSPPYPPTATQQHGYANGQQSQQQPQQHVPYVPIAVNGYPLYYPQQSQVNGQPPPAYYPRTSSGVYDFVSSAQQVQGQVPVMGQPGGGAHPQVQQNYAQGKPGNGNRRDFGHHYRGSGNGANGRPGRRGTSNGGSGINSSASGNGQPQANNSTSPRVARVPIKTLPLQVTTA